MKKLFLFLIVAVAMCASVPALADDFSASEIEFMQKKAVFEDPATEKQMRVIMPESMTKLNEILSTSTGAVTKPVLAAVTSSSGATLIGVYDNAGYFVGATVEAVLAEIGLTLTDTIPLIDNPSDGYLPTVTALGTLEMSAYLPGDFTLRSDVQALMAATGNENEIVTAALTGTLMPVAPAEDYRAFCTEDGGSFSEGKIYKYKDGVWDSGENVTAGQMVGVVSGDIVVGGTSLTDWDSLSEKLDRNSLACKDITVALNADTGTAVADPDWIDAYYLSASPVSGADQVVASVTIAGDGAITLVTAAVSTAQAVYRVCAILD